ncbi:unnamed protein product [Vicia faba]|uniref:Uncharacterized protein n=1 Tax=Vicia faba TaxID=3906 RepID=A0AAV1A4J2_VICFA|nr:unnamed protein product [Vicia faba]
MADVAAANWSSLEVCARRLSRGLIDSFRGRSCGLGHDRGRLNLKRRHGAWSEATGNCLHKGSNNLAPPSSPIIARPPHRPPPPPCAQPPSPASDRASSLRPCASPSSSSDGNSASPLRLSPADHSLTIPATSFSMDITIIYHLLPFSSVASRGNTTNLH